MKAIYRKRLEKLATHLEKGKLGHKKFDFSVWNRGPYIGNKQEVTPYKCGYAGCAIGECPIVFPSKWMFNSDGEPVLGGVRFHPFNDTMTFFALSESEARHLFVPCGQRPDLYGGKHLDIGATAKQVARNIRAFLKKQ